MCNLIFHFKYNNGYPTYIDLVGLCKRLQGLKVVSAHLYIIYLEVPQQHVQACKEVFAHEWTWEQVDDTHPMFRKRSVDGSHPVFHVWFMESHGYTLEEVHNIPPLPSPYPSPYPFEGVDPFTTKIFEGVHVLQKGLYPIQENES